LRSDDPRQQLERVKKLFTCCVITTAANEVVKPFHDRMPAILTPENNQRRGSTARCR
jgi:putative SOS response-associated peptidase YedK